MLAGVGQDETDRRSVFALARSPMRLPDPLVPSDVEDSERRPIEGLGQHRVP